MKKHFLIVAAAVAAVALVSCKKDDDKKVDTTGGVSVASENLVAYFPLNSPTDVVTLGKGVSFDKLGGKGTFGTGARGGCYESTGTVDDEAYLKLNVPATFTTDLKSFSVSAWIYQTGARGGIITVGSTDRAVDPNWGALSLFLDGGDEVAGSYTLKGYFNNNNENADWHGFFPTYNGVEVAKNAWIYITLTYDAATSKQALYVNGVQRLEADVLLGDGKAGAGEVTLLPASSCYIGAHAQRVSGASAETWLSYFAGKIDEIRVYNKGLSEKEVSDLYKAEVAVTDGLD